MSTFSTGTVLSFLLDEYDILTIDGQTLLEITPAGRHYYQTQTFGHQVVGPFGVQTTVTLTGQSAGSYSTGPSNQPSPVTMVDISAAQQGAPTAAQLAATTTLYQLNSSPYTIYQSNGSALVAIGAGGSGATVFSGLTDAATANLPAINAPLAAAIAAAGAPAQSIAFATVIPLDTAGNGKYMPQTVLNANSVFTVGASPIEQGNCNFNLVGNGSNIPDLSAFTNANSYSFSSSAGANNIYTAIFTYGTPLLYGTLGNVIISIPGSPTALTAGAATGTTQALTWTAPATGGTPTDYTIQYRTTAGPGSWNTFSHTASPATSITITGLSLGTSYDYHVAGTNTAGTGVYSSTITASTVAVPGQVTGLTLGTASTSSQVLTWSLPGGGAPTDYLVEYRTTVGPGSWTTFAHSTSSALTQTVTGLAASTSYDYRVSGVNSAGTGTASTTATGSTIGTAYAADNFNRADASSSQAMSDGTHTWIDPTTGTGKPGIASNQAIFQTRQYVDIAQTSYTVGVDCILNNNNEFCGPVCRYTSDTDCIEVEGNSGHFDLIKKDSVGGNASLGSGGVYTLGVSTRIEIVVTPTTITVKQDGAVIIGPVTNNFNASATKVGVCCFGSTTSRFDNFLASA